MFLALVTKNSVRKTGVRQASRMPNSVGYFLCVHLLLSLLVTFLSQISLPTDWETQSKEARAHLYGRGVAFMSSPRAEIPEKGSDWPREGHMPIFRPITAVRGWDIMTGSPQQKHTLRKGRTDSWKEKEVR